MLPAHRPISVPGGCLDCEVPGCGRAASHTYPVLHRLAGDGSGENLVRLCAAHLRAVRRGWVRVRGRAPDRLRWELGFTEDGKPLAVFVPPGE